MGIDIYMYAERRVGDHWELASPMERNSMWSYDTYDEPLYKPKEELDGRCYELWAILADVTNPYCSVEKYQPIAAPRGLPKDLSEQLQLWVDYWEMVDPAVDGWSWLTLRELLEFDWQGKTIIKEAQVEEDLQHLFQLDKPFPLDKWPEGRRVGWWKVSKHSPGVIVYWTETYADSAGEYFLEGTLNRLKEYGPPDDIRVVFWFKA